MQGKRIDFCISYFFAVVKIITNVTYRRNSLFQAYSSKGVVSMMAEQRKQAAGTVIVAENWGLTS